MQDILAPFDKQQYVNNDHKIGEKLKKLVTKLVTKFKLGQEKNQQGVLRSVERHTSLLDI